jgi:hypothetical protein
LLASSRFLQCQPPESLLSALDRTRLYEASFSRFRLNRLAY